MPVRSLSTRLLLLTIGVIMLVEILIYVPSVAQFRLAFLQERLAAAQIAALSLTETPDNMVSEDLQMKLLDTAGVMAVVLNLGDRRLLLSRVQPEGLAAQYDLRAPSQPGLILDAMATLARGGRGTIQVRTDPIGIEGQDIAVVLDEAYLYDAMLTYSRNVLGLSILISLVAGAFVYAILIAQLVRPMRRVTGAITRFAHAPEDPGGQLRPSDRRDEIGQAERELAAMQTELRQALRARRRLADLGGAISRINHDLRNILATAQLSADSLQRVDDDRVQRLSQRLVRAINRAVALCERTLRYGRADEPAPDKRTFHLADHLAEVGHALGLDDGGPIDWAVDVPDGLHAFGDPDQLFRVFMNLGRNAREALGLDGGVISVTAHKAANGDLMLQFADTGPGIPEDAQDTLFVPFNHRARGTGLGLAIAAEIMAAHQGTITLARTGEHGTVFEISLPGSGAVATAMDNPDVTPAAVS